MKASKYYSRRATLLPNLQQLQIWSGLDTRCYSCAAAATNLPLCCQKQHFLAMLLSPLLRYKYYRLLIPLKLLESCCRYVCA